MATKKSANRTSKKTTKKAKKASGKRELISPRSDKRYVRRDAQGQFKESDDQSRSLGRDVRKNAKKKVKAGHGDKGDQK
ncbi:MAG: hypothetical protein ACRECQ_01810 [Burkholderiaceae bacterium]